MPQAGDLRSPVPLEELVRCGAVTKECSYDYLSTLARLGFAPSSAEQISGESEGEGMKGDAVRGGVPASAMEFISGEDAALRRVEKWMFRDDRLKDYFEIRNGMLGEAYSSKLSPWLANGCISLRLLHRKLLQSFFLMIDDTLSR